MDIAPLETTAQFSNFLSSINYGPRTLGYLKRNMQFLVRLFLGDQTKCEVWLYSFQFYGNN